MGYECGDDVGVEFIGEEGVDGDIGEGVGVDGVVELGVELGDEFGVGGSGRRKSEG